MKRYVIFDRDGTLNIDEGYAHKVSDFRWIPGVIELLSTFGEAGITIFIATNQSGVGRGIFTLQEMEAFNNELVRRARLDAGVNIAAIAVCPHAPVPEAWCVCRKPRVGLLMALEQEFAFAKEDGCFIGDSDTDLEAAIRFGIHGIAIHDAFERMSGNALCDR